MNLLDILSKDPPTSIYNENNIESELSLNNNIIYLPTYLTDIQNLLIKLIFQIFSNDLLNELKAKKMKTSINNLLENNIINQESNNNIDKINLCFDQISCITNHPSLLIDHFIPKKLLLSDTIQRQINVSGKFHIFDRFVDHFINQKKKLLVIANNVKELELIEGIIIGRDLYYKNFTTSKLHAGRDEIPRLKNKLFIKLITSQQFGNIGVADSFDYAFSFDTSLTFDSPNIGTIYIPIPVCSIEHIILKIPKPNINFNDVDLLKKWKLKIINLVILNHNELEDLGDFFINNYGRGFKNLEHVHLKDFETGLVLQENEIVLSQKLDNMAGNIYPIDTKMECKVALAKYINDQISSYDKEIENIEMKELPVKRLNESKRQVDYDNDEVLIREKYITLKKLNVEASTSEKNMNRVDQNQLKLQEKESDLTNKLNTLEKGESEPEQKRILEELEIENKLMESEYETLNKECEEIRNNYQNESLKAVQLSNKLANLKEQFTKINNKINNVGFIQLPKLINDDDIKNYEIQLNKLKSQNQFMTKYYNDKIDKIYQERSTLVKDSSTGGSTSRPSNRISRGSTPLI
ncbi:unnamed protein product [Candida verbasci]|uniref:Uncharacterized protein n=1 Tax=Candida verbasci TaxID=1227364 RepID=A0A9W4TX81_9ASCO|nr:unnamed protein product [Candida verbasci]